VKWKTASRSFLVYSVQGKKPLTCFKSRSNHGFVLSICSILFWLLFIYLFFSFFVAAVTSLIKQLTCWLSGSSGKQHTRLSDFPDKPADSQLVAMIPLLLKIQIPLMLWQFDLAMFKMTFQHCQC